MIGPMKARPEVDAARLAVDIDDPALALPFTQEFVGLTARFDALVDAACRAALERSGAWPSGEGASPPELAARLGVPASARAAFDFLFRKLVDAGYLELAGDRLRTSGPGPAAFEEELARFVEDSPDASVGAELVALLVAEAPAVFSGAKTGEEVLFSPQRIPLWFRYFSNANPLYSINNALGATVLLRELPPSGARVLEVGGGAGSAAEALLSRAGEGRIATYRFTEFVPTFLRRGERAARASAPPGTAVEASRLDMTRPWAEQGIAPGSFDAVYAVNCFHVAADLDAVLAEAFAALVPGGALVLPECVKPGDPRRPIYVEFIFQFLGSFTSVVTHPERRPSHGFLSPSAWRASLGAAGFAGASVVPDVERLAERYPDFFVAAVSARRP